MAAGLAAELKESLGIVPDLVQGKNGVFEVTVDGTLVFSKKKLDRFPALGEVTKILREKT
jgi:selT/selW/selH-like putative selenoprotein